MSKDVLEFVIIGAFVVSIIIINCYFSHIDKKYYNRELKKDD
jgi:hypothetical protein